MKRAACCAALAWALSGAAVAERLTLDEALATVAAAHPDRRMVESDLALSRADREQAASRQDFSLFLDGSLRRGRQPDGDWKPDNLGRIVARKPLLDFGRTGQAVAAADQEIAARQAELLSIESLRRIDIMARYFDVLLADQQYVADNEFMTVAYLDWDKARERFELGVGNRPDLLRLEAFYQDWRERRNASLQRTRSTRQKLAHAMYRPGKLPATLAEPALQDNTRPVPEFDSLQAWMMQKNPRVQALQAQLAASDSRLGAIRAERNPTLDAEVFGAGFSRESTTRDELSAGLVFNIPLYQGGRVDARVAR
jgi:outer membrane protein TolC